MRRAFTLIELLIVLSVIALLAGLIIGVLPILRLQSRLTLTQGRMQDFLGALSRMGSTERTPGQALLEEVKIAGSPALGGVRRFSAAFDGRLGVVEGAWLSYDTVAKPWEMRFPWGRNAIVFAADGTPGSKAPGLLTSAKPRHFAMSQMNPRLSEAFWVASGLCARVEDYRSIRTPSRAWNDAWGNPLVVGYALYQYGPRPAGQSPLAPVRTDDPVVTADEPDQGTYGNTIKYARQQILAIEALRQPRIVYVSVGALGSRPAGLWANPAAASADASSATASVRDTVWVDGWNEINTVCNRRVDSDPMTELWRVDATTNAMADPPWTGVRRGRVGNRNALLTAPEQLP